MSITATSLIEGGTVAHTGGVAQAFSKLQDSSNEHEVFFDSTTLLNRKTAKFSTKRPKVSAGAPGGYTQARSTVLIKQPFTLANGNTTYVTVSITLSVDPELSQTEIDNLRYYGSDALANASLDDFWRSQSLD